MAIKTRAVGAKTRARPINRTTPTAPGPYYWSEWNAEVMVVQRRKKLFVTPPGGQEIEVTPSIAGTFKAIPHV